MTPRIRFAGRLPLAAMIALVCAASPTAPPAHAAAEDAPRERRLPFYGDWARSRGIELPEPFGAGLFMVTMSRDIEVTDVRVTLPGNEPASISDVASFAVRNHTTLAALKLDAWILPLLDLYVLAGHTWTDSRLDVRVTIDRPLGGPVVLDAAQDSKIDGPLVGAGATAVVGSGPWFLLVDANYNYTDIAALDHGIAAWFVSARTGWSGATRRGAWRAWLGEAYLTTDRTLTVTEDSPALGSVVVEVDQRPVHPFTHQLGGSLGFGKHWEVLLEGGSNFDDASMAVLSATFRF